MKKKVIVTIIIGILILSLVVSSLSYAFYKTTGISKEEHLSVVAKKLAVIFTDNSELTGEIYPGYEETKTFSVENKSESLFKYDIIFENLVNTFKTNGFLQYRITSEDGGYNMTDFEDIPKTDTEQNIILAYSVPIEDGKKHNYKLEIRYQNSDTIDQSDDMGRVLSGNLAITEGTRDPKLKQVTLNVENGTPEASTMEVLEGNDAIFEVTPNEKYTTNGATLTCDNDYSTILSGNVKSVTISNITEEITCTLKMRKIPSFIAKLKEDNTNITNRSSFSTIYSIAGLYVENDPRFLEDDGKLQNEVYYFAGDVKNNWVKFGKDSGEDIWWRIIRTNEDGSIRLLYAGIGTAGYNSVSGYIKGLVKYNADKTDKMYVGYMYGTTGSLEENRKNNNSSQIKQTIDNWYNTNLYNKSDNKGNYWSDYVSKTTIYCNDRSTLENTSANQMWWYGAAMRLSPYTSSYGGVSSKEEYHPTFKCGGNADGSGNGLWNNADVADKFTTENTRHIGNEDLTYPVALITADEIVYAGGLLGEDNENIYYYKNSYGASVTRDFWWWTMSPWRFYDKEALTFIVYSERINEGMLGNAGVDYQDVSTGAVRPVLSLKSCVEVTGKGTTDDPYIPSIDDACANADN